MLYFYKVCIGIILISLNVNMLYFIASKSNDSMLKDLTSILRFDISTASKVVEN